MKTVYASRFYDFRWNEGPRVLAFVWKTTTEALDDNDFREALSNFAGFGFELAPRAMTIDVRAFRPPAGIPSRASSGAWRSEVVVPRYNACGVERFAYLKSPDAPGMPVGGPQRYPGETFETAVFDSEEAMEAWVAPI